MLIANICYRYMEKTKREAIDFSLDFSGGDYNDAQLPHGVEGPAPMPHGASARRKRSEDNIVIEQVETTVVLEDKWAPGYIDTRHKLKIFRMYRFFFATNFVL